MGIFKIHNEEHPSSWEAVGGGSVGELWCNDYRFPTATELLYHICPCASINLCNPSCPVWCHCLCVYKHSPETRVHQRKVKSGLQDRGSKIMSAECRPLSPAADDASDTVHRGLTEDRIMRGQWSGAGLRRWQLTRIQQENGGSENTAEWGEGLVRIAAN